MQQLFVTFSLVICFGVVTFAQRSVTAQYPTTAGVEICLQPASLLLNHSEQPTQSNDDLPEKIVVGTWNVEWFYDHDQSDNRSKLSREKSAPSKEHWDWKLQNVAKVIGRNRPDIMALQEVENRHVIFELKKLLRSKYGLSYRIGFVEGFDTFTEQDVAILFRDGLVEMSRREQNANEWKSKKFKNLSKHLITRFEFGAGKNPIKLSIFNVHLRAMPDRENLRIQQGLLVRRWIDQELAKCENVILLGDFNTENNHGTGSMTSDIGVLRGQHDQSKANDFLDAHASLGKSERITHLSGKQYDRILFSKALASDTPRQNDLVFSGASIDRQAVIRGAVDAGNARWENQYSIPEKERDVSDHYPVFATFQIR